MNFFNGIKSFFSPSVYVLNREDVHVVDLDTASIYRTQSNLQAVITYLSDNVAQLPWKLYERVDETERRRVRGGFEQLFVRPNVDMTGYEFKRALVSTLLLYGTCTVLVFPDAETESGWSMYPVPQTWVQNVSSRDGLNASKVTIAPPKGTPFEVPEKWFIRFKLWSPTDPLRGTAPINALKGILTEQLESERYRGQLWKRQGRMNAYVYTPKEVRPLEPEQMERFKRSFKEAWTGDHGGESGGMPVLENGMEIRTAQFNAREAQWAEAKQLSREDVASAYHLNPALLWHTQGQTYASVKENARALYNDTLGPVIAQITERINVILLEKISAPSNYYIEFDLTAKTRGSFEERASILQSAVGAPYKTRNEARAEDNLPPIEGGDELITPLNVLVGGQASPNDTDTSMLAGAPQVKSSGIRIKGKAEDNEREEMEQVISRFMSRQKKSIISKLGAGADWWDNERWNNELTDDLYSQFMKQSEEDAKRALGFLRANGYNPKLTEGYIKSMASKRAENLNAGVKACIEDALENELDVSQKLDEKRETNVTRYGMAFATAVAGFAVLEAINQTASRSGATKTWIVTSSNPRASHASMDGETVPYNQPFSNGADFPGDTVNLDVAEVAGCMCEVEIYIP